MERNVTYIDEQGERRMAVVLQSNDNGTAELTYQASGAIQTVTAVLKNGVYRRAKEPSKEQA